MVFHFASLTKRLPAKSLCVKWLFFRAKPRSFFIFQRLCVFASLREKLYSAHERKFCFARERYVTKISFRSHKLHVESEMRVASPVF